ncbi:hypothetical protein ACJZ2D_004541 [Fusarium nematophilum]
METLPKDILLMVVEYFQIDIAHKINKWLTSSRKPPAWALHETTIERNSGSSAQDTKFFTDQVRQQYATLRNLTLVSKRVNAIAQPFLYETLVIDEDALPPSLVDILSRVQRLRSLVKHLHMEGLYLGVSGSFLQNLLCLGFPEDQMSPRINDDIKSGLVSRDADIYEDSLTALWLALTPNVQRISISMPRSPYLVPEIFADALTNGTKPFQFLEEVCLTTEAPSEGPRRCFHISDFKSLFQLPSFKSLRACCVCWTEKDGKDFLLPELACNLRHLTLFRSVVSVQSIQNILSCCKDLRTLHLDLRVDPDHTFSCEELGHVLRSHGQRLETLGLSLCVCSQSRINNTNIIGEIGSLESLKHLRHVAVSPNVRFI